MIGVPLSAKAIYTEWQAATTPVDELAPAGRGQGIGQGADMLAKDGPAAGDVLYPPSLIGLWRCERTVTSVEGDTQQACNHMRSQAATACAPRHAAT